MSQFWVDDVTIFCQNFKLLREQLHKQKIHLKKLFAFDFHLSINIGTWNTNLDLFNPFLGWWHCHEESNLQNLETVVSKKNTSPKIPLYYWLPFIWKYIYIYITIVYIIIVFIIIIIIIYYIFTIAYHHYTSWGPFWLNFKLMMSPRESKLQCFEKVISEIN